VECGDAASDHTGGAVGAVDELLGDLESLLSEAAAAGHAREAAVLSELYEITVMYVARAKERAVVKTFAIEKTRG